MAQNSILSELSGIEEGKAKSSKPPKGKAKAKAKANPKGKEKESNGAIGGEKGPEALKETTEILQTIADDLLSDLLQEEIAIAIEIVMIDQEALQALAQTVTPMTMKVHTEISQWSPEQREIKKEPDFFEADEQDHYLLD